MRRDRRGFTFVELMVVILVIAILAGMAVMRYIDLKHHAISAKVVSDLETIRLAAYQEMYEHETWPAETGPGVVPPEMVPRLGTGFTFTRPEYTLDWENMGGGGAMQIGVSVTSSNAALMSTLARSLGSKFPFVMMGGQLTLVIVGPDGQS